MKYAIIETNTTSHWVPGDERSRTNPGHGYPEGYETRTETSIKEYSDKDSLLKFLKYKGTEYAKKVRVIHFAEVAIEFEVNVAFKND